jgi:hypothetical protein
VQFAIFPGGAFVPVSYPACERRLSEPGTFPMASEPKAIAAPPIVRPPPGTVPRPMPAPASEEPAAPLSWRQRFERFWKQASSCLTSLALHAALVILLGLLAASQEIKHGLPAFVALNSGQAESPVSNLDANQVEARLQSDSVTDNQMNDTAAELSKSIQTQGANPNPPSPSPGAATAIVSDMGDLLAGGGELLGAYDADVAGSLGGRGQGARAKLLAEGGGNKQSEDAVERGLRWLQAHQNPDGSWLFDFEHGPCRGKCKDSGRYASPVPATALALLAFLGHGDTQREGEYQETVKKGLYYLCGQMSVSTNGGSLMESGGKGMYSHGLSAIAICEAYAMTREKELESYAQLAIDFIVSAQDKRGGGWRYTPGMPGDTTVSGWQIMALKSGQMAYLRVPQDTIHRATKFLDSVQFKQGAQYQYQPRVKEGKELTTTSVGLLCRLYTGWPLEHPGIADGVAILSRHGPSPDNMYFDYYATQVLHQWGGKEWQEWNYRMRDYLVRTQANEGHENGSWHFGGSWSSEGGRLYNTALAIMILEVYYRHLPLYGPNAIH